MPRLRPSLLVGVALAAAARGGRGYIGHDTSLVLCTASTVGFELEAQGVSEPLDRVLACEYMPCSGTTASDTSISAPPALAFK